MPTEPIVTDAQLKRIASADVTGEHTLMARELIAWRKYGTKGHLDSCEIGNHKWVPSELPGMVSAVDCPCTCGFSELEPFLRGE